MMYAYSVYNVFVHFATTESPRIADTVLTLRTIGCWDILLHAIVELHLVY